MLIAAWLLPFWDAVAARRRTARRRDGAAGDGGRPLPAGVDGAQLLRDARNGFLRLQAAWDARDFATLRHLTMPDVFEDLRHVLAALESRPSRTDVVSLHADLLGLEELGGGWLASVEFSGLIRESPDAGPVPFRELWMLAADKDDRPAWRLARQQALL